MHEIIEDNFLGPWPRLVLPCPLNFRVRGCDHLAVTCSLTLHAYVKRCLPMTNGERTVLVTRARPRVLSSGQLPSAPRNPRKAPRTRPRPAQAIYDESMLSARSLSGEKRADRSVSRTKVTFQLSPGHFASVSPRENSRSRINESVLRWEKSVHRETYPSR